MGLGGRGREVQGEGYICIRMADSYVVQLISVVKRVYPSKLFQSLAHKEIA